MKIGCIEKIAIVYSKPEDDKPKNSKRKLISIHDTVLGTKLKELKNPKKPNFELS